LLGQPSYQLFRVRYIEFNEFGGPSLNFFLLDNLTPGFLTWADTGVFFGVAGGSSRFDPEGPLIPD
jgi:hypothetical protein